MNNIDWSKLSEPFPAEEIEWRVGSRNREKTSGIALAYLNARAVMQRLDDVVGPENWKDEYVAGPDGGVMCKLSIRIPSGNEFDEWVSKCDVAENTDIEEIKGGVSGAFKRAAVRWGIGRYLYYLDAPWVPLKSEKYLQYEPELPSWALPGGSGRPPKNAPESRSKTRSAEEQAAADRVRRNVETVAPEASEVFPWIDEFNEYMENYPDVAAHGEWVAMVIGQEEPTYVNIDNWLAEHEENDLDTLFGLARHVGIEMEDSNAKQGELV